MILAFTMIDQTHILARERIFQSQATIKSNEWKFQTRMHRRVPVFETISKRSLGVFCYQVFRLTREFRGDDANFLFPFFPGM